jgi:predicted  nucleic acid-binding Zn-ribbon protein
MNQGKALYELQEIDLKLLHHAKRLQTIADQLADNETVQAAQKDVSEAEANLQPLQTKMRDIEMQIQSTHNKRDTTEKRLYGGFVTNPKELQDMQQEIESLKRWETELEDRLLEVMLDVEEAEDILNNARQALESVLQTTASENQDLLAEKQTLESEVQDLQTQHAAATEQVEAQNLQFYQEMRPQKGNQPIATLTADDACSACGIRQMGVSTKEIRRGTELMRCKNCKRIRVAL